MRKYSILFLLMIAVLQSGRANDFVTTETVLTPCGYTASFTKQNARCYAEASGQATIVVQAPPSLLPLTYEWYDGSSTATKTGLAKGTYFVKVTDNTGCLTNYFVTIEQPDEIKLILEKTDLRCFQLSEGAIDLSVTGGTPGYQYSWMPTGDNTQDLNNLLAGTYTVEVEDSRNCQASASITLTEPPELIASSVISDVLCNGGNTGEINLTVSGGVPLYNYDWSNGNTLQDAYNLTAGDYTVLISDDNFCELELNLTVNEPLPIETTFEVTNVKCYGDSDGKVDLTVTGGTTPYAFVWSNTSIVMGETTEDLVDIPMDKYYVKVTDKHLCVHIDSAEVKQSVILVTNVSATAVTCYDFSNGAVDLSVTGGTLPYSYLWNNSEITQDLNAIKAGIYSVTIADSNGCTAVASIQVTQPTDLSFGFEVSEVTCVDNTDGKVNLYVSGASPPYTFLWENSATTQNISDLVGGNYTVEVTDDHSCLFSASVSVPTNPRLCITVVTVPNAFSPNGDNVNDVWVIHDHELYPDMEVKVINVWGETVFESVGYWNAWDGTHNGRKMASGTYYYTINVNNGVDEPFTGTLTLIR